jgi:hypothetical protein
MPRVLGNIQALLENIHDGLLVLLVRDTAPRPLLLAFENAFSWDD